MKLLSRLKVGSEGKVVDPWALAKVHSLQDQGWILGDAVRIQMKSKRRKYDQNRILTLTGGMQMKKYELRKDARNEKFRILVVSQLLVEFLRTRRDSRTFGEKHVTIIRWKWCGMWELFSPWQRGYHGGSRLGGRTCTLLGRCTSSPLTPLQKLSNHSILKKMDWFQQSSTSESCTSQNEYEETLNLVLFHNYKVY